MTHYDAHVSRVCSCGDSITVDSTPATAAADLVTMFDKLHSELGHSPGGSDA